MTLIAVSISVNDLEHPEAFLEQAMQAKSQGAGLVEWRIDGLENLHECVGALSSLVAESPMPSIVTCRSSAEGGDWNGAELQRAELLAALCQQPIPPRATTTTPDENRDKSVRKSCRKCV